ncbi:MAG: Gfo/Idh/MocA family oxidoreductase, partial [Streptococcus gallolyticus]|nr:Gfo/Idh/MocA family oxidoreductase [Streptococcus gallolyticus]
MLKLGIIGAGRIGLVHLESILRLDDAKVVSVADPFMKPDKVELLKDFGVENTYEDYHEILKDPEIDAVLICSSTDTHSPISIEAIEARKHVFCEKPIDHSIEKIRGVIKALEENPGIKYQVGFNRRFDHNFEAVEHAVRTGQIGETQIIKISSRDPEPPPVDYIKVSGGLFLDMMIHDFDMVRFL